VQYERLKKEFTDFYQGAMLGVAPAGALAATGALAQSKPVDKASQKFIS